MRLLKLLAVGPLVLVLAGCLETDGERALAGAAGGAVAADLLGANVLTGAAIGAAGGAVCDDLGVCN